MLVKKPEPGGGTPNLSADRPSPVPSLNIIYREGETPRPTFHGSHAERHWPKYAGAAAAILVLGYMVDQGKGSGLNFVLIPLLFGFAIYLALRGIRKSANDLHTLRTEGGRSPVFMAGAVAGLLCFVYWTFMAAGPDWGPRPRFGDGFQRQDLAAAALLLIQAAGFMACGGWLFQFIAKRFRRGAANGT
jgi:hypothetical protein